MRALSNAVEARDAYTGKHAERVTAYGIALAEAVGLDTVGAPGLEFGFLLHDVGKLAVPDAILYKPDALSAEEFSLVARHPVGRLRRSCATWTSSARASSSSATTTSAGTARGYPDRLAGDAIPLPARVFAVADALDALTTDRPYRRATRFSRAREEIRAHAGTQFDPEVVAAFETISDERFAEIRDAVA